MRRAALLAMLVSMVAACGPPDASPAIAGAAPVHPVPCARPTGPESPPVSPEDWPVYGRTPDRHGAAASGGPAANRVEPAWTAALDGSVFAQPLVVGGLVVTATQHDTVYALDSSTGCLAWRTSLGTAFDVRRHRLQCNNIEPELGVTATPAVDGGTGALYVVAFLDPGRYEMDALDLATGAVRWRHSIELPGSDVLQQLSRPAIAIANGRAYASFGGRAGDCGTYHGFVVGVRLDGAGPDVLFQAGSGPKAAVWAPGGPVVLPGGDLLVAVGNSDELRTFDGSNSVDRLSPDLARRDSFTAPDWAHLNQVDFDLGSVGPTVLDGGRVFQVGKDGVGYLLDADRLGGVGGELFHADLTGGCYAIGTTAVVSPLVYVPCDHSLTAVRVSGSRFDVAWRGPDFRSGSPIVAGGLVWDYDFEGGIVWGFDPASGAVRQRLRVGAGEHFVAPSAARGRLFVPERRRLLAFSFS